MSDTAPNENAVMIEALKVLQAQSNWGAALAAATPGAIDQDARAAIDTSHDVIDRLLGVVEDISRRLAALEPDADIIPFPDEPTDGEPS